MLLKKKKKIFGRTICSLSFSIVAYLLRYFNKSVSPKWPFESGWRPFWKMYPPLDNSHIQPYSPWLIVWKSLVDKMFESSFRYCVSSFRYADTFNRVVVFWVLLGLMPVRFGVLRCRLVVSWVLLVVLSVRFVGWPLRLVVLQSLSFRRFVTASRRFV